MLNGVVSKGSSIDPTLLALVKNKCDINQEKDPEDCAKVKMTFNWVPT